MFCRHRLSDFDLLTVDVNKVSGTKRLECDTEIVGGINKKGSLHSDRYGRGKILEHLR